MRVRGLGLGSVVGRTGLMLTVVASVDDRYTHVGVMEEHIRRASASEDCAKPLDHTYFRFCTLACRDLAPPEASSPSTSIARHPWQDILNQ